MLQLVIVLLMAGLWFFTINQTGGADFLHVRVFVFGLKVVWLTEVLIAIGIGVLMATTTGALQLTAGVILIFWGMIALGMPRIFEIDIMILIVFVAILGTAVHLVTSWKS
jgi:hypothetical protein